MESVSINNSARPERLATEKDVHLDFGNVGRWSPKGWLTKPFTVSYELIFWVCFFGWTAYFIIDRFTGNFMPPTHTLNDDPLLPSVTPFSVLFFDNFNRATGRLFITVCSALLWTQCKTSENLIQRYKPNWLITGDLRSRHNRIHYLLGLWGLAVPMYVHILLIFLPVMIGDSTLEILDAAPSGHLTPFVKADSVNLFIIGADVFRLILAVILFFFVLPISISNFLRRANFNIAHWLHLAAALAFSMDIMRGTHPHSQLFNGPMVVYYIIDRVVGLFVWKEVWTFVDKRSFDNNSVHIYYFKTNAADSIKHRPIGNVHYVKVFAGEPLLNFSHPYTCFYNRTGESLSKLRRHGNQDGVVLVLDASGKLVPTQIKHTVTEGEDAGGVDDWDVGLIMRSAYENRGAKAFSVNVPANDELCKSWTSWGPYISEYAQLKDVYEEGGMLLLQCTSAGLSYIIDLAMHVRATAQEAPGMGRRANTTVHVLLSTRSFELIQWATGMLLPLIEEHGWEFHARFTQAEGVLEQMQEGEEESAFRSKWHVSSESLKELLKRLAGQHLLVRPKVFFCGDPKIQWASELTAKNYDCEFFRGSRFSAVGFPYYTKGKDGQLHCFSCPRVRGHKWRRICWFNAFPMCCCY